VTVPDEGPGEYCVYQTYMIQADDRDLLQRHLVSNGVEALIHYATPIHMQPAAESLGYGPDDFPVASRIVSRILSLPLYPGLTEPQQDQVVDLVAAFYRGRK
jgi:dTDP-4-amino-4,6-dideoxygalactose transaminase